jgi:hypothetical protein
MFSNYQASQKDLKTIKEALEFVMSPKMRFVFKNKSKITNTTVVSYDSKFIYVWKVNPAKLIHKIPHNLRIPDEWQRSWWASIISEKIEKYLSMKNKSPIISGGLLTPFIVLQKAKNVLNNPYITRESYLATIVHEFGHIYFGGYGKKGELSAFCTEYYASRLFWLEHTKLMNKFHSKFIDLPKQSKEYLHNIKDPHIHAMIFGRKIMSAYPKSWPTKLIK